MNDPSTYWLTLTNIALGAITLICCGAVVFGVLQELAAKHRKHAALARMDSEVSEVVAAFDGHTFQVPSLGVTMADGGEEVPGKEAGK